ncbi:MAG: NADH-quinone oxidoreductase subunit NuoE family protein [Nitrospiraceae bacterium]
MTSRQPSTLAEVIEFCRPHPPAKPNLLKTLLTIQQALGRVPIAAVPQVAQVLGVTEADVAGVLSYYPDLRTETPGRHVIRVCMGESCLANRCPAVFRAVRDYLDHGTGETDPRSRFTVEAVYCMGNCALSPTVAVDQDIYGRVEPERIPSLMEPYR